MTDIGSLGRIDSSSRQTRVLGLVRVSLLASWIGTVVGYHGPWINHTAAGLMLSGPDMGEFVKFLPGVLDGSLLVLRQVFYLPVLAIAVSIALLIGSPRLRYPRVVELGMLGLAYLFSLQFLPPAWSPASLVTAEFRLQAIALFASWLILAGFWLWGRLPARLTGLMSAGISLVAIGLSGWQFLVAKPAIDNVYGTSPGIGWGTVVCLGSLAVVGAASLGLALRRRLRGSRP